MKLKNKKGQWQILLNPITIFLFIILIIFFATGGISATYNLTKIIASITNFLTTLPTIAWIFIGIIFLLIITGKKRRR